MTLTEEQIAEIRARVEAATPGPWRQEGPRVYFGYEGGISLHAAPNPINNSHFIAHARTDIPLLISALEAANKRADEAEALVETLKREAQLHAQEARTANATIAEIYREVSGGKGEPGNWNGAEPVRAELTALRARVAIMQEALEIIAGKRQCLDNLMGNKDVALAALTSKGVKP